MKLFYREYGEGKPLVILHGILGTSDNWVSFGRRISAEGFHVYIPDQRNHGRSPHHPVFNYNALLEDLLEFIEHHKIVQPLVLGHSMGGKLAMRYALENPDGLEKLIIVDTSLRTYMNTDYHEKFIDAMLMAEVENAASRAEVEKSLSKTIDDIRIKSWLLKNLYWRDRNHLAWRPDLKAIRDNLESVYDGIFYSSIFAKPVLFIKGGHSNYIVEQDHPMIYRNFPQAKIITIEGATHWVHADEPEEFFRVVSDFIN